MRKIKNIYKKEIFRALSFALIAMLVLNGVFLAMEPNLAGAAEDTDVVLVNLSVTATISLDTPADVTMAPDIAGTGISNGSVVWSVITNNSAGYKLEVNASTDPAMLGVGNTANQFADFTEGTLGVAETWNVATTDSEFGFTAKGDNEETEFADGTQYLGFQGSTKIQVTHEDAETAGSNNAVDFRAEVGSAKSQPTGSYRATVTATATTL